MNTTFNIAEKVYIKHGNGPYSGNKAVILSLPSDKNEKYRILTKQIERDYSSLFTEIDIAESQLSRTPTPDEDGYGCGDTFLFEVGQVVKFSGMVEHTELEGSEHKIVTRDCRAASSHNPSGHCYYLEGMVKKGYGAFYEERLKAVFESPILSGGFKRNEVPVIAASTSFKSKLTEQRLVSEIEEVIKAMNEYLGVEFIKCTATTDMPVKDLEKTLDFLSLLRVN